MQLTASKIKRRDGLIPACVALDFSISGTWNGQQYCQVIRDVAGTIGGTMYEGVGLTGALYTLDTLLFYGSLIGAPGAGAQLVIGPGASFLGGSAGSTLA